MGPHYLKLKRGTSQDTGKVRCVSPLTLKDNSSFPLGKTKGKRWQLLEKGYTGSELFCYRCRKGVGLSEEELFIFPHKTAPLLRICSLAEPALEGSEQLLSRGRKCIKSQKLTTAALPLLADKPEAALSWVSESEVHWAYFLFLYNSGLDRNHLII